MKLIGLIFLSVMAVTCSRYRPIQALRSYSSPNIPYVMAHGEAFPLELNRVKLRKKKNFLHLSDGKIGAIQHQIADFYFNDCQGDSAETYFNLRDTYEATLWLKGEEYSIYYIILHHQPIGGLLGRAMFFDQKNQRFIPWHHDHKIFAMYEPDKNGFFETDLKKRWGTSNPEIEIISDEHGISAFKFTRLYHNGTANAIETTVLQIKADKIDTVYSDNKWFH